MNKTVGKVLTIILLTIHPTIKKTLRFIRQKKHAEPLSGEKYFNGNTDRQSEETSFKYQVLSIKHGVSGVNLYTYILSEFSTN